MSFPCGHPHWSRGVWSQLVVGVKGRWVKGLKTNLLKSKSPTDCHILKHAWPLRERRAAVVAAHPSNPWCWLASWDAAGDLAWTVIFLFGLHHPITKATRKHITLTGYIFSGRMDKAGKKQQNIAFRHVDATNMTCWSVKPATARKGSRSDFDCGTW